MENYRQKIKTESIFLAIGAGMLIVLIALSLAGIVSPAGGSERWQSFFGGFIGGAAFGICVFFIVGLIKNLLALKNEDALKKLYVKNNDERSAAIHEKGKAMGSTVFLLIMLPISVVCGYLNITVFFSCISCILLLSLIIGAFKLYYSKKL